VETTRVETTRVETTMKKWKILALPMVLVASAAVGLPFGAAQASESWNSIREDVYGSRVIENGLGRMTLEAPFRPQDQSAVPIAMTASLGEGRRIKTVSFIVDENPSPVAAVFRFDEPRRSVALKADFRLNRATDVRAVVEADDGKLYMLASNVKFAPSTCVRRVIR